MPREYYRITLADHLFVGIVDSTGDKKEIQVGGAGTRKCCIMKLDIKKGTTHIIDFIYRKHCRVLADLERGPGTHLLIRASVFLAFALYPEARTLTIQDESTFPCESVWGDTHHISLSDQAMLVHGQTWYQRKLPGLEPHRDFHPRSNHFEKG